MKKNRLGHFKTTKMASKRPQTHDFSNKNPQTAHKVAHGALKGPRNALKNLQPPRIQREAAKKKKVNMGVYDVLGSTLIPHKLRMYAKNLFGCLLCSSFVANVVSRGTRWRGA
jgi:hypothetical protein